MTFSKLTWLKRTDGHKFTGAEFRVLIALFNHSGADGTNSHPGIKRMMAETGYGKAAVSTAVTGLKTRGWIHETSKGSGTSGNASVFALVAEAPNPPSSSSVGELPTPMSSSPGGEPPTEVVRLERTSSSPGANRVVRLEQSPSDPDIRSGSDPDSSDQSEVRYPPNHLEEQYETFPFGRSLSVGGSEATEEPAALWPAQPATGMNGALRAPEGIVGLLPATGAVAQFEDPFAVGSESMKRHAERAAAEKLTPASAGVPPESPWD